MYQISGRADKTAMKTVIGYPSIRVVSGQGSPALLYESSTKPGPLFGQGARLLPEIPSQVSCSPPPFGSSWHFFLLLEGLAFEPDRTMWSLRRKAEPRRRTKPESDTYLTWYLSGGPVLSKTEREDAFWSMAK